MDSPSEYSGRSLRSESWILEERLFIYLPWIYRMYGKESPPPKKNTNKQTKWTYAFKATPVFVTKNHCTETTERSRVFFSNSRERWLRPSHMYEEQRHCPQSPHSKETLWEAEVCLAFLSWCDWMARTTMVLWIYGTEEHSLYQCH